jgi:hypothetical protein
MLCASRLCCQLVSLFTKSPPGRVASLFKVGTAAYFYATVALSRTLESAISFDLPSFDPRCQFAETHLTDMVQLLGLLWVHQFVLSLLRHMYSLKKEELLDCAW